MSVRVASFNAENLMQRFDFSGFKNLARRDRTLGMLEVIDKAHFKALEEARVVAHTDDTMQLTALAIADCRADIICLQEVENLEALEAFERGYLRKITGESFQKKVLIEGNDTRGIDVCLMMRDKTLSGEKLEFVRAKSHAHLTYADLDLHNDALANTRNEANEKIFRRDCLEVDVRISGKPLTLYISHFKSMGGKPRDVADGRDWTMPIRQAEAAAIRKIIERRFGKDNTANKRFLICGDLNDYQSKVVVKGDRHAGYSFEYIKEERSGLDVLTDDGFSLNLMERRAKYDQWTLFHFRSREEQHLCQLDYILASPAISKNNKTTVPEVIRNGQPFRTPFPEGQAVERYPRTGWDRPKSSDHCPIVVELEVS